MTLAQATVVRPRTRQAAPLQHFVFEDVPWDFYERTLVQLERAGQHARVTYDQGRMEIMTVTAWHENIKTAAARLLEHYSFVMDIPIKGLGNLTCRRKDLKKGLEPDECYYIRTKPLVNEKGFLDLVKGPPPDLVIEVEVTRSDIPKQPIYQALRVPELWRLREDRLTVLRFDGKTHVPIPKSVHFPKLDMNEFFTFIKRAIEDQHEAIKAFDRWLRGAGPHK